jgi:hypothetical protein
LLAHGRHVGEDRVGLLGLLQRLGLLDPLEAIIHAVEDVPHRSLFGEVLVGVAFLVLQGLQDLGRRQVGVAPLRLQLGVGLGVWLDDGPDVRRQLGVLLLAAQSSPGGEVFHATDVLTRLVQSLVDRVATPAETSLGLAGVAGTQLGGDLGLEQAAWIPFEALGSRTDQALVLLGGSVHKGCPLRW